MTDCLTNVGHDYLNQNASTLNGFASGSAFSTVYNVMTRQFLAQPSGNSRLLSGAEPQNLVPRRAGHAAVNRRFSEMTATEPSTNLGLTLFLEEGGEVSIEWRSISVNGLNPSFTGDLVPEDLRPQITEDVAKAVGRTVRSR